TGLFLSAVNVRYRDVPYAVPFLIQIWMYLSGVVYAISALPERWQWVLSLNPMTAVINGFQWGVLQTPSPDVGKTAVSIASMLLKILTRITTPTSGSAEIRGRVGSLLEVGTGFHPELTGRENVYLNGSVLGMKRREITTKFDEIVEFAGVERFIDTPVKRYSSGMSVRLAFAVAAHLEPEILLVDEVLAVGDAEFQKRCLGRMQDFGASGRTVVFVSHNMQAIARLCERTLLVEGGRITRDGASPDVVAHYLHTGLGTSSSREWSDEDGSAFSD